MGTLTRSVFTDDYRLFLGRLVDARKRAGLRQAELARALVRPLAAALVRTRRTSSVAGSQVA
jgi:hypothetical protein